MRKVKTIGIATISLAISIAVFASAVPNQCDDNNVVQVNGNASHPFWGSATVGTYGYLAPDGCMYSVSCVTKYRFWINFGTEAIPSDVPLYCN